MKKFSLLTTCAVAAFVLLYAPAFAGPSDPGVHLNWGSQINQSTCPSGKLVINVNQKVVNDCDSGTTRPCWALDGFVRHIQVVQVTGGFCATVSYQGNFTTIAGDSPQAVTDIGGTVGDDVVGTFEGGYRSTTFTGTLLGTPTQSTRGSIGTFDYACDGTTGVCPGFVDWTTFYFSSTTGFDLAWWGWIYHGGLNGTWVNASTGNSGDITGD
jgi:hypothetical protein